MIHFRPMPLLSLLAIGALAILLFLGHWQAQRAEWKRDLMAQWETAEAVTSFRAGYCQRGDAAFGPKISAPVPLSGEELRFWDLREGPGWLRLSVMRVDDCEDGRPGGALLVERGFEPLRGGAIAPTRNWRIVDVEPPSMFDAANNPETNEWHSFDLAAMEDRFGLTEGELLPVWARSADIDPASFARTTPAVHMGYAVTWYGLAVTLIGVYLAFHIARGRLRLSRCKQD
jgi:surfeit locus 1 family protein